MNLTKSRTTLFFQNRRQFRSPTTFRNFLWFLETKIIGHVVSILHFLSSDQNCWTCSFNIVFPILVCSWWGRITCCSDMIISSWVSVCQVSRVLGLKCGYTWCCRLKVGCEMPGLYRICLDSDAAEFGGHARVRWTNFTSFYFHSFSLHNFEFLWLGWRNVYTNVCLIA